MDSGRRGRLARRGLAFTPDQSLWKKEAWAMELMATGDAEEAEAQAS